MLGGSHKSTQLPYVAATEDKATSLAQGGLTMRGIAAGTLKIGDSVFLNGTLDTWAKSATPANYATANGIVVGGYQTGGDILQDDALIGSANAALVGEMVIVLVFGVAKTLADAALATNHVKVTGASTTAGRVGTTSAAAGNYVGVLLDTATGAASVVRVAVGLAH